MANYPQLDDCSGVWTLKEVNDAVMGGYWRNAGSIGTWGGGGTPGASNVIDFNIIASAGNATDFGDLTSNISFPSGAVSNLTRGVFTGGYNSSWQLINAMEYITIASTGNSTDFGDLTVARHSPYGCSGD